MILFSCRRTAELTSKGYDTRLTVGERLGAGGHRLMCADCRRFRRQMDAVERAVAAFARTAPDAGDERLPEEVKERIVVRLNEDAGPPVS